MLCFGVLVFVTVVICDFLVFRVRCVCVGLVVWCLVLCWRGFCGGGYLGWMSFLGAELWCWVVCGFDVLRGLGLTAGRPVLVL